MDCFASLAMTLSGAAGHDLFGPWIGEFADTILVV
jgi:hypothetical protein